MTFLQTTWLVMNGAWECVLNFSEVHSHCEINRFIMRAAFKYRFNCVPVFSLNLHVPRWRHISSCFLWLLKCSSNDSVTEWLSGSKIVSQNPITALHELCPLHMCPQPSKFFNLKIKAEQNRLIVDQPWARWESHQLLKICINYKYFKKQN